MDRYGGSFGAHDDAGPFGLDPLESPEDSCEDFAPHAPPSPVGQDERRMQVRAYNHWAALLGDASFPDIGDLHPEQLDDFGPYGILLDFRGRKGIDDPRIAFIGAEIAAECSDEAAFRRLSDVPGRSLLSRITDHYMQIIANQAPIGFEAEFTNRRGAEVLYRGILLPWSSDGETIDFVFGVINWKELADAETAERLLNAIDEALGAPIPPYEDKDMDRMLDLSGFAVDSDDDAFEAVHLPMPAFGTPATNAPLELTDEIGDEEDFDEDAGEPSEWGAGFSGFGEDDAVYAVDYGDQGLEEGEDDEDYDGVVDPLSDETASLGLASLVSRSCRIKQSVSLPGMAVSSDAAAEGPSAGPVAPRTTLEQRLRAVIPQAYQTDHEPLPVSPASVAAATQGSFADTSEAAGPVEIEHPGEDAILDLSDAMVEADTGVREAAATGDNLAEDVADGLYDCLAAARELAQTARSNEDRGRKALYQAVARAYDFSLEAAAHPADFDELLAENGLTVQDRAPMTPIVKLVFGADYDKTRLTEYAAVLGYAHRVGVERGTLHTVLSKAEGGLKGIVAAERQARREAEGKPAGPRTQLRPSLARTLRKLEPVALDDLAAEGEEFALVMVRRLPSGELVVLGEVPNDLPLVEKAAKKLIG